MSIWKLFVVVFILMLFNTCRYFGHIDKDLRSAWEEVNQEKDIFEHYENMKEEAFVKFLNNAPESDIQLLDYKINQEEQRILKVQSLIEHAHKDEISALNK